MNFDSLFHRNSFLPRLTPILCALCVASFLGLNLGGANMTWAQSRIFGYLPDVSVWTGAPWSLISSTFVHLEIMHILFNVMLLWSLGNIFENEFGSLRFAAFFLGAAWVSSALQLLSSGGMGIGMSGVGYALFGFGWLARRRFPAFAAILTQQNVIIFLVWLVGCWVATEFGTAHIANGAHLAGLLFGAAVAGGCFIPQKLQRALSGLGVLVLVAASFVPLFWCPLSSDWTGLQAKRAQDHKDLKTASYWYERTIARDPDATWALHNLAVIYLEQYDRPNFNRILKQLSAKDPDDAHHFDGAFGLS